MGCDPLIFVLMKTCTKGSTFPLKVGDVGVCNAVPKKRPPPELRVHPRRLRMRNGLHSSSVVLSCYSMISWKLCCRSRFHEIWQHSTGMLYAVCRTICPYVLIHNSREFHFIPAKIYKLKLYVQYIWSLFHHTPYVSTYIRAYKHLQTSNHCMIYKFIYILSLNPSQLVHVGLPVSL